MSIIEETYRSILTREQRIVELERENAELRGTVETLSGKAAGKVHESGTVLRE